MAIFIDALREDTSVDRTDTLKPFVIDKNPMTIVTKGGFSLAVNEVDNRRTTFSVILPEIDDTDTDADGSIFIKITETDCDNCRTTFSVILPKKGDETEGNEPILIDLDGKDCDNCRTTFSVILPKQPEGSTPILTQINDAKCDLCETTLNFEFPTKAISQQVPLQVKITSQDQEETYKFTNKKMSSVSFIVNYSATNSTLMNVEYTLEKSSVVDFSLQDSTGKVIKSLIDKKPHEAGTHRLYIYQNELKEGYILNLATDYDSYKKKIVLLK